jgi:catechol 2,3-dioxygenase-like lactoylglutathione lyase family enzyme
MKRLHVHVRVKDLDESIGFYSTMFDEVPSVKKDDYAKWMLDDPRINFAISTGAQSFGVDHLGIQVEDSEDLKSYAEKMEAAGRNVIEQEDTVCCYARSDKAWVSDPQGVPWETFLSLGEEAVYGAGKIKRSALMGDEEDTPETAASDQCCTPAVPTSAACCGGESDKVA